jgi:hypothetical protein
MELNGHLHADLPPPEKPLVPIEYEAECMSVCHVAVEERYSSVLILGIQSSFLSRQAHNPVTILTELSILPHIYFSFVAIHNFNHNG